MPRNIMEQGKKMQVIILEKVTPGLRGELSRWFIEPKTGVFVGRTSALVRDKLWEKICSQAMEGGCLLVYSSDSEQGYRFRSHGVTSRKMVDFEGIFLARVP
jgi:CRISPR-associated protein Cas2